MESSSLGLPRTPNRATSEGPSPPPRNSMEDADSSVTRKRPRLDSGDRAYRSMSADGVLSTPPRAQPGKLLPHSNDEDQPQIVCPTPETVSQHAMNGTPSKVTINVRDTNVTSSPPQPVTQYLPDMATDRRSASTQSQPLHVSSSPPVTNTVSSSPPCSPEIEVAELEDIDGHGGPTIWRAADDNMSFDDLQNTLLDEFPLAERYNNVIEAVNVIANHMFNGTLGDGELLHQLGRWIEEYLEQTKNASSQWFNLFTEAREFWEKVPNIVSELVRRNKAFDEQFMRRFEPDDEPDNGHYLQEFFTSYTALTARMLQIDCQTLQENAEDTFATPDLVSPEYVRILVYLFWNSKENPLWKMLHTTYGYPIPSTIQAVVCRFTEQPSCGLKYLTQYVDLLLDRSQSQPRMVADIWVPINLANRIASCLPKGRTHSLPSQNNAIVGDAFRFFQAIDAKVQTFITKQVSSLSLELTKGLISELSSILRHVAFADESLIEVLTPRGIELPCDASLEDRVMFVEYAWRFGLCKKCITKGRMEIRVQGVETMQEDLVAVYGRWIADRDRASEKLHIIPQYLSDSILSSKLVDYIVGVESHPQLIPRSKNIVGFLLVTGRYTKAETDLIWKTVSLSQDSRTIDAIIDLLSGIIGIIRDFPTSLCMFQKLIELPIRYFDGKMLTYCRDLRGNLVNKWEQQEGRYGPKLVMAPYHLCLRLVREVLADSSLPPHRKREIFQFAFEELKALLDYGPSDEDAASIYRECIADISGRTPFASGSMAALNVFLEHNTEEKLEHLASTSNFAALMIDEFSAFTESKATKGADIQEFSDALHIRLSIIQKIIVYTSEVISSELSQRLWTNMLGEQALGEQARDYAWTMLANAACTSHADNAVLDRCVEVLLPELDPRLFTWGVLNFAEKFVQYETRAFTLSEPGEEKKLVLPGTELLWHLSLVVPNSAIGSKAINMLVKMYLDGATFQRNRKVEVEGSHHANLVERCILNLNRAASRLKRLNDGSSGSEDDSMVIVPSENDIVVEKTCFARCLSILKEFMHGIRSQLPVSPAPTSKSQSPYSINGDIVTIPVQIYTGSSDPGIKRVEIGDLATFGEFVTRLVKLSGFSKLSLIVAGARVNQPSWNESTLRELKLDQKGLIIVQKGQGAESVREEIATPGLRPLEREVMKHFRELYDLLGIDEQLGKDVYDFLGTFPPHEDITAIVCDETSSTSITFPLDAPYKTLYSVYALKSQLTRHLQDGTINHRLVQHGVRSVVAALLAFRLSNASSISQSEIIAAVGLIECLLRFLKEPVSPEISTTYFDSPSALLDRLRQLISSAQGSPEMLQTAYLIQICFNTMLEASLYSKPVWHHYKSEPSSRTLISNLLLESANGKLRDGVLVSIRSVCGSLPSITECDTQEFVSYFWDTFVSLIPDATQLEDRTEQFFSIALEVFRSTDNETQEQLPLASYVEVWSKLLLNHRHDEFVGRESIDWTVHGITGLLQWCIVLMRSKKRPLNIDTNLFEDIFRTHLFPEITDSGLSTPATPRVPILDSSTRGRLYSVLLALSTELSGYRKLLSLVKDLLPQGEDSHAWEWGIAQIIEDYHYEPNWNFERIKTIRAPTGYPGIRNLSNTCYLNSLFTQLYMNVGFRSFMLQRNIADGEASQKLLSETQKLFASMQESWLKCVDPQGIADSVITYESSPIDVSIQMDVDEFYNLLFDRWESQIPSAADKKTFRQFYGGQIVQQIKSKQCPHISERLEPFSAIQCEIQGKATLAESLNAYVEGEVMEGDNKYSCSSCGSYVDAVKRACLKDIPDNLIFHLKRFDYDLSTGTRSKINDHFEFPEEIDMAPYDVEYLKDPEQCSIPDYFTLVGVLVHSGTAESGHYYSYIRERPAKLGHISSWVEFNDSDVTRFDPCNIPDQCFGGLNTPMQFSTMRYEKQWNAYMLFYQRTSSMKLERESHMPFTTGIPVKEPVPIGLQNRIVMENELYIRRYSLFDPEHAKFIKSVLEQRQVLSKGLCSDDHGLEREVIWLTLEHLDQVFSRTKDSPRFHNVLDMIIKMANACSDCCKLSLDWVSHHENALRNLLLRSPDEDIRRKFGKMVAGALKYLRVNDARHYGIDVDSVEQDSAQLSEIRLGQGALQDLILRLKAVLPFMHLHSRAWDEYYGLLSDVAQFGRPECVILHREDFLSQCLEVLTADCNHGIIKRLKVDRPHHVHYARLLEKGRKFSLCNLLNLLAALLSSADLRGGTLEPTYDSQLHGSVRYRLSSREDLVIRFGADVPRTKGLWFLDKAISLDCNPLACQKIVRILTAAEVGLGLSSAIEQTILSGVSIDPASGARPYLHAALAFCETCRSASLAKNLVMNIAAEVETIGNSGGEDHLEFFTKARRIRNEHLARRGDPNFFHNLVLKHVPRWAPTLLIYPDPNIRTDTINLLHTLVFSYDLSTMDDEKQAEDIEDVAKELCHACLKRISDYIIVPRKEIDARMAEEIVKVIRHCVNTYFTDDDGDERTRIVAQAEAVLEHLQGLLVSSPDGALSGEYDSEEVLTDYSNEYL